MPGSVPDRDFGSEGWGFESLRARFAFPGLEWLCCQICCQVGSRLPGFGFGERGFDLLFADVKGSMDLAEQLDPEDWHEILDRFFYPDRRRAPLRGDGQPFKREVAVRAT